MLCCPAVRPAGTNPEYVFLSPGGTDHEFFRWALFATGCGLPVEQPPPQGFVPPPPPQQQQAPAPAAAVPPVQQTPQQYMPPQQQYYGSAPQQQPYAGQPYQHPMQYQQPHAVQPQQQPRPAPPPIAPEVAAGFSQVLDNLSGSKVRRDDLRWQWLFPLMDTPSQLSIFAREYRAVGKASSCEQAAGKSDTGLLTIRARRPGCF